MSTRVDTAVTFVAVNDEGEPCNGRESICSCLLGVWPAIPGFGHLPPNLPNEEPKRAALRRYTWKMCPVCDGSGVREEYDPIHITFGAVTGRALIALMELESIDVAHCTDYGIGMVRLVDLRRAAMVADAEFRRRASVLVRPGQIVEYPAQISRVSPTLAKIAPRRIGYVEGLLIEDLRRRFDTFRAWILEAAKAGATAVAWS